MKLIQKYLAYSFLKPFFAALIAFLILMIVTHFFDYMHTFLDQKPPIDMLAVYFLNRIPDWFVMVMPVAALLAVLFSLGSLKRHGEITAIGSSGISILKALKPLILISILISISSLIINETVVPPANRKADNLFRIIRGRDPREPDDTRKNFSYAAAGDRFYFIEKLSENTLYGVKMIEFLKGTTREISRMTAERAVYTDGSWEFYNGTLRDFSPDDGQSISFMEFEKIHTDLPETPVNFEKAEENPESMGFIELLRHTRRIEKGGLSSRRHRVILHHKISFPFSNTIILILGIPLALWGGMKSRTAGFFIALLIAFIYWGAITVGRAMGVGGILSPMLAAWSANIIFLLISVAMMKNARIF